jgi:hypothetical protein
LLLAGNALAFFSLGLGSDRPSASCRWLPLASCYALHLLGFGWTRRPAFSTEKKGGTPIRGRWAPVTGQCRRGLVLASVPTAGVPRRQSAIDADRLQISRATTCPVCSSAPHITWGRARGRVDPSRAGRGRRTQSSSI